MLGLRPRAAPRLAGRELRGKVPVLDIQRAMLLAGRAASPPCGVLVQAQLAALAAAAVPTPDRAHCRGVSLPQTERRTLQLTQGQQGLAC